MSSRGEKKKRTKIKKETPKVMRKSRHRPIFETRTQKKKQKNPKKKQKIDQRETRKTKQVGPDQLGFIFGH